MGKKFKVQNYRYWAGEHFEVLDGGKVHDIHVATEYNEDIKRHAQIFTVTFLTPVADGEEEQVDLRPYVMDEADDTEEVAGDSDS